MLLPLALAAGRTSGYRHYTNARFAYALDAPEAYIPGREPDNGDGRAFTFRDGEVEVRVWGG